MLLALLKLETSLVTGLARYLQGKWHQTCQSESNNVSNRDAWSCVYSHYLCTRQYDYHCLNSVSVTAPADVTGGREFSVPARQTRFLAGNKAPCSRRWWILSGYVSPLTMLWFAAGARRHLLQLGKPSSCSCQTVSHTHTHTHTDTVCVFLSVSCLFHCHPVHVCHFRQCLMCQPCLLHPRNDRNAA